MKVKNVLKLETNMSFTQIYFGQMSRKWTNVD